MILDHDGNPVETNAPEREHDTIQVVLAFPEFIRDFEEWLTLRGLHLAPGPRGEDDLPTYIVSVRQAVWERTQNQRRP